MPDTLTQSSPPSGSGQHVDVLIVGAGLSGIGAAWWLQKECPRKTYAILEQRDAIGGTWDLFRYPGIRSDSDMYTLGYAFRPWTEAKAIADGPSILKYVRETAPEAGIDKRIHFNHKVISANWDNATQRWTVTTETGGKTVTYTANFLMMCSGYYRYEAGYTPHFEGMDKFKGRIVHPQKWTADIDHAGKNVVVIGSGATAVTLVPEMAKTAKHVTMLQRSPTYVVSRPAEDKMANWMRKWMPAKTAYNVTRWRNVTLGAFFYNNARKKPQKTKEGILKLAKKQLPEGYDLSHFTPSYNPWDQRMCLIPDADLFQSIKDGKSSVVTDQIETFTETGIKLKSGKELQADLVVTATGLDLLFLGGMKVSVDGADIDMSDAAHLQGHDVFRHSEPRLGVRLHQRLMDAEGGPHLRICLPPAELHGREWRHLSDPAQQRSGHDDRAVAGFLVGLCAAHDLAFPEAGFETAVEAEPELQARHQAAAQWRAERRRDDVRESRSEDEEPA